MKTRLEKQTERAQVADHQLQDSCARESTSELRIQLAATNERLYHGQEQCKCTMDQVRCAKESAEAKEHMQRLERELKQMHSKLAESQRNLYSLSNEKKFLA